MMLCGSVTFFIDRVHADAALGGWIGDDYVRRKNHRLCSFHFKAVHSLLCHGSTTEPAEGDFSMEVLVEEAPLQEDYFSNIDREKAKFHRAS
ncbi:hypothetical protein SAY86_032069 [Trapa natans]|uniref:Uncharacterized protein n=1 Tax=Trapa natans TaxID=22666 RepID=A0AAN7R8X5_TRANT|nr:hypothetical protein SAY86_032069 [Trapa natans]